MTKDFKKYFSDWKDLVYKKIVEKNPERQSEFTTASFSPVEPLYGPINNEEEFYENKLGMPGSYPFTRGIQPTMYRGKLWTMRQYAGFGSAKESNKRYRYLLEQGQMGLSVAFDLPTQIGYDSDDPISFGEVGKVGVAIDTLADMEILFDSIPLDKVSTSMTINATASVLLAFYIALAEKQNIPKHKLSGTVQNDILKEYIARGTYIFPPKPSMRLINDIFSYCSHEMPKWNTISISGYHIREAGSTAAQEVGFTLANGIAYVETALQSGLPLDDFTKRISFFFNSHNDLFEEVAKFRAARRLWARIMKERFGAKDPRSMMLRFHTQTAGSTLTAQQADNNIVRVTIQALAAILGGTQSLHTNSRDEALALPTEESVTIALRTQQILAYESGVANTIDPLAGSYFVESLTDQIEKEAESYISKIDSMGGMISAIEKGYVQSEIQNAAYRFEKELEAKKKIIVGVNQFQSTEKQKKNLLKIDIKVQDTQIKFLKKIKAQRNNNQVNANLLELKNAAEGTNNLMPYILESARSYASLGEICNTLRSVFGTYKENITV